MKSAILLLLFLAVICRAAVPDLRFAWKQLDFAWNTPADRENAIKSGKFVVGNSMPQGVARWKNKLFVTVPRWKNGTPATLNYVDLYGAHDQPLKPYPTWSDALIADDAKELPSNSSIVCVFRVAVDACDRLWVMDIGVADILGSRKKIVEPSILVFDLNTDQLLNRYFLKPSVLKDTSFIPNIVVDADAGKCDDAFVYLPDTGAFAIVVYSLRANDAWRVEHLYFHIDPLSGEYNVNGLEFQWPDGISAMTLSEPWGNGYKTMFFQAMSSTKAFYVSTELLRNYRQFNKDEIFHHFKLLGDRGGGTQSSINYYDPKTNVLFYTQLNRNGVGCWNAAKPYMPETNPLIMSHANALEFPSDLKVDSEGILWVMGNRMPRFVYNKTIRAEEVKARIFSISTADAIKDTACTYSKILLYIYAKLNLNGVGCWNATNPHMPETNPLIIYHANALEDPSDLKAYSDGNLWIMANRMPRVVTKLSVPCRASIRKIFALLALVK